MRHTAVFLILLFSMLISDPARATVDWKMEQTYTTGAPPLDIAGSADGKWTFVLTEEGEVLIYSKDGKLHDQLKVDPDADRIAVSGSGEKLYVSSNKNRNVQEFTLSFSVQIDTRNAPFLGEPDAPVEIIVFSDFQ